MDDMSYIHHKYIGKLCWLIKERPALWRVRDHQYNDEKSRERYWDEIVFRLQTEFNSKEITVESCKTCWQRLCETFFECSKHCTASRFRWFDAMIFLVNLRICCLLDGMFARQFGKWLLPLHAFSIIMSVITYITMAYNDSFPLMVNMNGLIPIAVCMFLSGFALVPTSYVALKNTQTIKNTKALFLVVLVTFIVLISSQLVLIMTQEAKFEPMPFHVHLIFGPIVFFLHICSYDYHAIKLSRPPMLFEYMAQLCMLIGSSIVLIFLVPIFAWSYSYCFFSISLLLQAAITIAYVVVATRNRSQYTYAGINNYYTSPETLENPFTLIVLNKFEKA